MEVCYEDFINVPKLRSFHFLNLKLCSLSAVYNLSSPKDQGLANNNLLDVEVRLTPACGFHVKAQRGTNPVHGWSTT